MVEAADQLAAELVTRVLLEVLHNLHCALLLENNIVCRQDLAEPVLLTAEWVVEEAALECALLVQ